MKKIFVGIFFLSMIASLKATMFGGIGDLEKELGNLKEYKTMKGKDKCNIKCYLAWDKNVQKEDGRFSKIRYRTRSQTKKNKEINNKLLKEREICLKKCR